ncbi:glycosyltransferase family 2 protein [Algoriphagus formosus]|uniref:glycosyltransferase family 2 protein n=1 Tax=Algoriphagus formosus TaxID=2007308 RepID=UPI000C28A558|nr:glycosyltransferase [Algoriphagus formosus]
MSLDIIIPTYNRNYKVLELLNTLLQDNSLNYVSYKIIDNDSDRSVKETIIHESPNLLACNNLKIITNKKNVGLGGNIMRCFEYAEADWTWIIGDDDPISIQSINLVLGILNNAKENDKLINFSSPWVDRNENKNCHGLDDFLNQIDSFQNAIYLCTSIYRTADAQKYIEFGYKYIHTLIPHFFIQLKMIESNCIAKLLKDDIFLGNSDKGMGGWSIIDFQLNKNQILNYPFSLNKKSYKTLENLLVLDRQPLKTYYHKILSANTYPNFLKGKIIRKIFEENRMLYIAKSKKEWISNLTYYFLSFTI